MEWIIYSLASVLIISLAAFVGIFTVSIKLGKLKKIVIYMISFAAGAMMGTAFFHLLPHAAEEGFTIYTSTFIIGGLLVSFIVEKVIRWRHCHIPTSKDHPHPFSIMNLFGDAVHNLIDGMIIAASYMVSIPIGIATSLAVLFHEIPQEIGDFGVLIHGGFTRAKALLFNFLTALTAVLGAIIAIILGSYVENLTHFLLPFAAGIFIYVAGADLIPEMHKEVELKTSLLQLTFGIMGAALMLLLSLNH